jgi:uncharacterized membrane protein YdjX (TVP38/TMEM64 family)
MVMREAFNRRNLGWWAAGLGMVAAALIWADGLAGMEARWREWIQAGSGAIRGAGAGWYFLAMAVMPLPLAWFTVPAGEAFAEQMTLGGVVVAALAAVAVQLALSYWAGRHWLRPALDRWLRRSGREVPQAGEGEAWRVILLVRLTPGPPMILGSALLAAARVPFGSYMVISWLVAVPWVIGGVVMGRGLLGGDWALAASGTGALIAAGLATRYLRRRAKERPGTV